MNVRKKVYESRGLINFDMISSIGDLRNEIEGLDDNVCIDHDGESVYSLYVLRDQTDEEVARQEEAMIRVKREQLERLKRELGELE